MIGKTVRECLLGTAGDGASCSASTTTCPGLVIPPSRRSRRAATTPAAGAGQRGRRGRAGRIFGGGAPASWGTRENRGAGRPRHLSFQDVEPQADKARLDLRDGGAFDAEVQRLLGDDAARSMRATPSSARNGDQQVRHILVCGWRPEWTADLGRFAKRVVDVARDLPMGSTLTCLNVE